MKKLEGLRTLSERESEAEQVIQSSNKFLEGNKRMATRLKNETLMKYKLHTIL